MQANTYWSRSFQEGGEVKHKQTLNMTVNVFFVLQSVERCWGDGTEEISEAWVWRRNKELLLWGGLHLREHWERVVLLHLTGQCHIHAHTYRWTCCQGLTWLSHLTCCRRDRASLNTGWTIYVPNTGRCFITSTFLRASQSVSCFLYLYSITRCLMMFV